MELNKVLEELVGWNMDKVKSIEARITDELKWVKLTIVNIEERLEKNSHMNKLGEFQSNTVKLDLLIADRETLYQVIREIKSCIQK